LQLQHTVCLFLRIAHIVFTVEAWITKHGILAKVGLFRREHPRQTSDVIMPIANRSITAGTLPTLSVGNLLI